MQNEAPNGAKLGDHTQGLLPMLIPVSKPVTRRNWVVVGGSVRLEGAPHPAGDNGEAAGPVHGEEAEGAVEVHADVGDVVGQLVG